MTRILFLEDEPIIQEVTAEYMKLQNYDVITATDGEQAIDYIQSQEFDLAILDIMVPMKSGLEVLSYINENRPQMATIMLTALGDEQMQVKAFNLHADDYITKPFSPLLLLKRIETILRRTMFHYEKGQVHSGLYMDKDAYQAYYNNQPLGLTVSEFLLLQTLEQEPRRVFTREQLIVRMFHEEYISNDRIVDAHVKNLRKKLPYNYVKTIIGIGYQFQSEE